FLVRQERLPARIHRVLVGPGQDIDELELLAGIAFPHVDDPETVPFHDAQCMVLEALVEGVPVVAIELVDPQLLELGVVARAEVAVLLRRHGGQGDEPEQRKGDQGTHVVSGAMELASTAWAPDGAQPAPSPLLMPAALRNAPACSGNQAPLSSSTSPATAFASSARPSAFSASTRSFATVRRFTP